METYCIVRTPQYPTAANPQGWTAAPYRPLFLSSELAGIPLVCLRHEYHPFPPESPESPWSGAFCTRGFDISFGSAVTCLNRDTFLQVHDKSTKEGNFNYRSVPHSIGKMKDWQIEGDLNLNTATNMYIPAHVGRRVRFAEVMPLRFWGMLKGSYKMTDNREPGWGPRAPWLHRVWFTCCVRALRTQSGPSASPHDCALTHADLGRDGPRLLGCEWAPSTTHHSTRSYFIVSFQRQRASTYS